MVIGEGLTEGYLTSDVIEGIVHEALNLLNLNRKRVLVIIPDTTRTMPMPFMFDLFEKYLRKQGNILDYLVALGTHPQLNDQQLSRLVGRQVVDGKVGGIRVVNHAWDNPDTFIQVGMLNADEISQISGGLLVQDVPIRLNKLIFEYDQVIICGPVFPHEVVGFSGGNKYLFPGIAGEEIINFTHWLGALITSFEVIGKENTPVRVVIDRAADFIKAPISCLALVVDHEGVAGIYFGPPKEAWQQAARLSSCRHVIYKNKPYMRVLSIMPKMYTDLWTAAKGMYKVEPVVANGGEVIIYAPHIHEVSYTHGKILNEIGYHCRDYYLKQWKRFKRYPAGILAHSTHLTGLGEYDAVNGIESPRIHVTLATGISSKHCQKINLGYLSPTDINFKEWEGREDEGILIVPQAGELLYRLNE